MQRVENRIRNFKTNTKFDAGTKTALQVHHLFHQLRAGLDLDDPMRGRLGPLGEAIGKLIEETLRR